MFRQPGFWILMVLIIAWVAWVGSCAPQSFRQVGEKLPENITQNFNSK